jgi:hypothetical protein
MCGSCQLPAGRLLPQLCCLDCPSDYYSGSVVRIISIQCTQDFFLIGHAEVYLNRLALERFSITLNRQRSRFSLILGMTLSEKSTTFRDHALAFAVARCSAAAAKIPGVSSAFAGRNSLRKASANEPRCRHHFCPLVGAPSRRHRGRAGQRTAGRRCPQGAGWAVAGAASGDAGAPARSDGGRRTTEDGRRTADDGRPDEGGRTAEDR